MLYDCKNPIDRQKAITKFEQLINDNKVIELKEKKPKRSISQNSYLHLLFTWFAIEYGETVEHVKQVIFKQVVNPEIFKTEFANKKTGELRVDWLSTSKLDTAEMTLSIDRFRNYATQQAGIYLPEPSDLPFLQQIEIEAEKHKEYL